MDLDGAPVFAHDVVGQREPEPGSLIGRLSRKERVEDLVDDIRWDTVPIVADADFYLVGCIRWVLIQSVGT